MKFVKCCSRISNKAWPYYSVTGEGGGKMCMVDALA